MRSGFVATTEILLCFGCCCAALICLKRWQGCCPSKVSPTALARELRVAFFTNIVAHATGWSAVKCASIETHSAKARSNRAKRRSTREASRDAMRWSTSFLDAQAISAFIKCDRLSDLSGCIQDANLAVAVRGATVSRVADRVLL